MARSVQYNSLKSLLSRATEHCPEPLRSEIETALTRTPGQPAQYDHELIRAMRAEGKTAQQIAEALGCSMWTVYKIK